MNKNFIIFGLATLLISIGFSGCLSSEEEKFIGSWKNQLGQVYRFEDGLFSKPVEVTIGLSTAEGTWKIENNMLYIDVISEGKEISYKYTYSFRDNQIILSHYSGSGVKQTLTKI